MASETLELESVERCPLCGTTERAVLHGGVTDGFFGAPGVWSIYRCLGCTAAYLDPRPTPTSMELCYRNYYTHGGPAVGGPGLRADQGRMGWLKERLRNGYLRARFCVMTEPGWKWAGAIVPVLFPRHRVAFDTAVRHLPLPRRGARLLDVGCGAGDFLVQARVLGWDVTGLEIDPDAAAKAAAADLTILQRPLSDAGIAEASYDAVTMNHVVEHLQDPAAAVREAFRILRPGGRLWIATPNLDSPLHRRFGKGWRGLEVPRHVVLFSSRALRSLVHDAGFVGASWPGTYPLSRWIVENSAVEQAPPSKLMVRMLEIGTLFTQACAEQLVILASKPEGASR